jgi:hypothetical protein
MTLPLSALALWLIGPLGGLVGDDAEAAGANDGPAALAPGPAELLAEVTELERRVEAAEAALSALRRVHNALAVQLQRGLDPCVDGAAASLLARTPALGALARDRVQAAQAERARVGVIAEAPTVRALVDGELRMAVEGLHARVEAGGQGYQELVAWQERFLSPWGGCPVTLSVAPGLSQPSPRPPAERTARVAILGVGGGHVCPGGEIADGRALLVLGAACWSPGPCDCAPLPVEPAAVLGPPPTPARPEPPPVVAPAPPPVPPPAGAPPTGGR